MAGPWEKYAPPQPGASAGPWTQYQPSPTDSPKSPTPAPQQPEAGPQGFWESVAASVNPVPAIRDWIDQRTRRREAVAKGMVLSLRLKRENREPTPEEAAIIDQAFATDAGQPEGNILREVATPAAESVRQAKAGDVAGAAGTLVGSYVAPAVAGAVAKPVARAAGPAAKAAGRGAVRAGNAVIDASQNPAVKYGVKAAGAAMGVPELVEGSVAMDGAAYVRDYLRNRKSKPVADMATNAPQTPKVETEAPNAPKAEAQAPPSEAPPKPKPERPTATKAADAPARPTAEVQTPPARPTQGAIGENRGRQMRENAENSRGLPPDKFQAGLDAMRERRKPLDLRNVTPETKARIENARAVSNPVEKGEVQSHKPKEAKGSLQPDLIADSDSSKLLQQRHFESAARDNKMMKLADTFTEQRMSAAEVRDLFDKRDTPVIAKSLQQLYKAVGLKAPPSKATVELLVRELERREKLLPPSKAEPPARPKPPGKADRNTPRNQQLR